MTNHFHAIDPQGVAHTRSSQSRVYAFTVVARPGQAAVDRAFASVESQTVTAGKNFDRTVRHSRGEFDKADLWRGDRALTFWREHAVKFLAEDPDYSKGRKHVVERARQKAQAAAEAYRDGRAWDRFHNVGWCSRRDLADKLAAQQAGENVVILAAVPGKPPKVQP